MDPNPTTILQWQKLLALCIWIVTFSVTVVLSTDLGPLPVPERFISHLFYFWDAWSPIFINGNCASLQGWWNSSESCLKQKWAKFWIPTYQIDPEAIVQKLLKMMLLMAATHSSYINPVFVFPPNILFWIVALFHSVIYYLLLLLLENLP